MKSKTPRKRAVSAALTAILSVCMVFTMMPITAFGVNVEGEDGGSYANKTVILYTGNLRGDIDKYARLATAKDEIGQTADAVYLVDAGNYLQGTAYANTDRGKSIYDLMSAAGYDVAAMGAYEFAFGEATTGQKWHGNLTKYHTQKMLYRGQEEIEYNKSGNAKATLAKQDPAGFKVISSNISGTSSATIDGAAVTVGNPETLYSFDPNAVLGGGGKLSVGFAALTDTNVPDMLQDGYFAGLSYEKNVAVPNADVVIGLSNTGDDVAGANATIKAPTNGEPVIGALAVTYNGGQVTVENIDFNLNGYNENNDVANKVAAVKAAANEPIATAAFSFIGKNSLHRSQETSMGDLVTDALLWYAKSGKGDFDLLEKGIPIVSIQNGGNVRESMHSGVITKTDLFAAYPYSPKGIAVVKVTGEQLLASLEAATQGVVPGEAGKVCNGFAQVSGLTYNIDPNEKYQESDKTFRSYPLADSYNRVSITSIEGGEFALDKVYYLVADYMLLGDNRPSIGDPVLALDTYGVLNDIDKTGNGYISNGSGTLTHQVVAQYLSEECGGVVPEKYAQPQGRITFGDSAYKKAKAAMQQAAASGTAAQYLAAAQQLKKEADLTQNPDKIKEAEAAVKEASGKVSDEAAETNKIKAQKIKMKKAKAGKKSLTVTWKKNSDVAGYEISYKTGKKTKVLQVKKNTVTKKTIKKLKKGKKYTVKVRGYKVIGGTPVYTNWSKAKTVKIK